MAAKGRDQMRGEAINAVVGLMNRRIFPGGVLNQYYSVANFGPIEEWFDASGVKNDSTIQDLLRSFFEREREPYEEWEHDGSHAKPETRADATFVVGKNLAPDEKDQKASDVVQYFSYSDGDGINLEEKYRIAALFLDHAVGVLGPNADRQAPVSAPSQSAGGGGWQQWKAFVEEPMGHLTAADQWIDPLIRYMKDPEPGPIAVSGSGGLGKTAVTVAALSDASLRSHYQSVIWVKAKNYESASGVNRPRDYDWQELLLAITAQIGLAEAPADSVMERSIAEYLKSLPATYRILCVVDNIEGLSDGADVIDKLGKLGLRGRHRLVVTSRPAVSFRSTRRSVAVQPLIYDDLAMLVRDYPGGQMRDCPEEIIETFFALSHGNPYLANLAVGTFLLEAAPAKDVVNGIKSSGEAAHFLYQRGLDIVSQRSRGAGDRLMQSFCRNAQGAIFSFDELKMLSDLPDEATLRSAIGLAVRLNLVQATIEVEPRFFVHSLLYDYLYHERGL